MRGGKVSLIVAAVVLLTACTGSPARPAPAETGPPGPSSSPSAPAASPSPSPSPSRPPSPSPSRQDAESPLVAGRYRPVWPFASPEEVRNWRDAYRDGGRQGWLLDPAQTALAFTREHLGFRGIDVITSRRVSGRHARIGVGYRPEPGAEPATAAVVHLVRYGDADPAPWEVVGTDDTTLTLTTPRYGAAVTSPVTVGGRVTGVDESIRVTVLGRAAGRLGEHCCLSAGGERSPWSARLSFRTPVTGERVLTVVASTGGHVAEVERFAITAIRLAR